jgi:hypothetical protein
MLENRLIGASIRDFPPIVIVARLRQKKTGRRDVLSTARQRVAA